MTLLPLYYCIFICLLLFFLRELPLIRFYFIRLFFLCSVHGHHKPKSLYLVVFFSANVWNISFSVINYSNSSCAQRRPMLVNATTGFISTLTLDETGHGSSRCPLQIQVISIDYLSLSFSNITHFGLLVQIFSTKIYFAYSFDNQGWNYTLLQVLMLITNCFFSQNNVVKICTCQCDAIIF